MSTTVLDTGRQTALRRSVSLPVVRPNAWAATLGILGLASVWRAAADLYGWPGAVADAICVIAAILATVLGILALPRLANRASALVQDFSNPLQAPFMVVPFIVLMLLGIDGLAPHSMSAARVFIVIGLIGSLLLGGLIIGSWLNGPIDVSLVHPGYYLPVLGTGLIGPIAMGVLGHRDLAWMFLGMGLIGWLLLGSVLVGRLMLGAALPASLSATRAIELAPPAVACSAYLGLNGGRVDPVALGLGGFTLLMVIAQLRLLPAYRKARFPGYWAFGFPTATVAGVTLRWLALEHPAGERVYAAIVIAAITALIGSIALGSLVVLARRFHAASPDS